jgi:hypothetical protein
MGRGGPGLGLPAGRAESPILPVHEGGSHVFGFAHLIESVYAQYAFHEPHILWFFLLDTNFPLRYISFTQKRFIIVINPLKLPIRNHLNRNILLLVPSSRGSYSCYDKSRNF